LTTLSGTHQVTTPHIADAIRRIELQRAVLASMAAARLFALRIVRSALKRVAVQDRYAAILGKLPQTLTAAQTGAKPRAKLCRASPRSSHIA
jgi:hypothetical protein